MMPIIKVEGIGKSFEQEKIFKDLSFEINQGNFLSILGESGVGKSTLLRLLAGLEPYDTGQIFIDGERLLKPSPKRMVVFQELDQLFPWKTVLGNVMFPLKFTHDYKRNERKEKAMEALQKVGLYENRYKYPRELSGGMKQRVAIARAIVSEPEILLLDEPFGSLDIANREKLQDMLLELWGNDKMTIVFVTHDLEEAVKLSTHILVLGNQQNKWIINEPSKRETQLKCIRELIKNRP